MPSLTTPICARSVASYQLVSVDFNIEAGAVVVSVRRMDAAGAEVDLVRRSAPIATVIPSAAERTALRDRIVTFLTAAGDIN